MDLYTALAYKTSRDLTLAYSTSFGISSRLFSRTIRSHIYAIYGLVRIADEIVDTYTGENKEELLNELEKETYAAISRGYSTNLIVHAFVLTARQFSISKDLLKPFFASMLLDVEPHVYDKKLYESYIYGSAEVIGLMCLRVFSGGDDTIYAQLSGGAKALGAAYQKVNFLRDFASDYHSLNRIYFPGVTYTSFNEKAKSIIIKDIQNDIKVAQEALSALPKSSRVAVATSLSYYNELLRLLEETPATIIKKQRIRVPNSRKMTLLIKTALAERFLR